MTAVLSSALVLTLGLAHTADVAAERVIKMQTSVEPEKYVGPCPVDLHFSTFVMTDYPSSLTYQWIRNRKEEGEVMTSGTESAEHVLEMTWTVDSTGAKGDDFRATTKVITPNAATASPGRAYVMCTETRTVSGNGSTGGQTTGGGTVGGESGGDESAPADGDDAPIEFGTLETDVVGDDPGAGGGSATISGGSVTITCPERTGISILDEVPEPWWSTGSYATLARVNVFAADRLLACEYGSGSRRVRLQQNYPTGAASCVARNNREFYCTD